MILSQLRLLARAMIPGAKISVVKNSVLDLLLNEGVKDIAAFTLCLKANKKFNAKEDKFEYILSDEIGDFLGVDKSGLWWYNGTQWREVFPKTLKWLDENKPNWRSLPSSAGGRILCYSIEADVLTVHPTPGEDGTDYFWLYYGAAPNPMTAEGHYPFTGSTTELTQLSIFDIAIIKYAKWLIQPMLSKDQQSSLSKQEYEQERAEKNAIFYRRKDIMASPGAKASGPRVGK